MNGQGVGGGGGRLARVDGWAAALCIGLTLALAVVVGRVAQLQVAPSDELAQFVDSRTSLQLHSAPRGDIVDRRGRVLAATWFGYRVIIDARDFEAPHGPKLMEIARAAGLDENEIGRRGAEGLARSREREAQGLSPARYIPITDTIGEHAAASIRDLGYKGVFLEDRPVREQIAPTLAASIVGKVGFEDEGMTGAEMRFDEALRPEAGSIRYVRDHMSRPMWVDAKGLTAPTRGDNIRLSMDLTLQQIAQEELERGIEHADASGGRCLIIDPATGEILAMVQHSRDLPGLVDFDPKRIAERGRVRYRVVPRQPAGEPSLVRNRCVEDVYEPGSAFKPFVWSVITERGLCKPDEVFQTHWGEWKVPNIKRVLHDVAEAETMSWKEVLLYSSNIGMAQGALRMQRKDLRNAVLRFGFGSTTRIGLEGETAGLVTTMKDWSDYTQTSVCMGQEVGVTAVQLARAFCVFARNGDLAGTLPSLRLTALPTGEATQQVRDVIIKPETALLTREVLGGVAERMRERFRQLFPDEPDGEYTLFGKSGTAEVAAPKGKGYLDNQYISTFVGGAPLEAPRIVVLVAIEDPGPKRIAIKAHYGSAAAGPVVLRITDRALEYLGIPPDRPLEDEESADDEATLVGRGE